MGKTDVANHIRTEKSNARCVDELVQVSHRMWELRIGPNHEGLKRSTLDEDLDLDLEFKPRTLLMHLVEIEVIEEFQQPGPATYVIAEWHEDTFVMGDVDGAAEEGIAALIGHIHDEDRPTGDGTPAVADGAGVTLRHVVAAEFGQEPETLEDFLRQGDPVEKLNRAVDAIEESEDFDTTGGYGPIEFRNAANHYRLTQFAVDMYDA